MRNVPIISLRDELPDARRALLTEVVKAALPFLKPVDPNAKPSGTSINISMGANGAAADMVEHPPELPVEPL